MPSEAAKRTIHLSVRPNFRFRLGRVLMWVVSLVSAVPPPVEKAMALARLVAVDEVFRQPGE